MFSGLSNQAGKVLFLVAVTKYGQCVGFTQKTNKVSVPKQSIWLQNKVFLTSRWRDVIIVGRQSTKPTNYKAPKAKPEKQL